MSAWSEYKLKLGETRPWDIINPNIEKATEEVASARWAICEACPELIKLTKQCKQCRMLHESKDKDESSCLPTF